MNFRSAFIYTNYHTEYFWKYNVGRLLTIFFFLIFFTSCNDSKESKVTGDPIISKPTIKNEVEIQVLKKQTFKEEILANGKLEAIQKSILKFKVSGVLENIKVGNGDLVQKGEILASLDSFEYQQAMSDADNELKRADLEFRDLLVGRGYDLNLKDSIPNNIYEMASIRSGYLAAKNKFDLAQHELKAVSLSAPFSGKVAAIKHKNYERINAGEEFLTLIDDKIFEVNFHLIESEINRVQVKDTVDVSAFGNGRDYKGVVTSINPIVEENGIVLAKAKLISDGNLLEGMNVTISIQKEVPNQFVIPKATVVNRQDKDVVFKYKNGKTYWTYIKILNENSKEYCIVPDPSKNTSELIEGDTLITSGHLNLGHNVEVSIKN